MDGFNPFPLLHVVGAHLVAVQVGEVLEGEYVEDIFRGGGDGIARHALHANIIDVGQLCLVIVAVVGAFNVALRCSRIGRVGAVDIEGKTDKGVGILHGHFQRDIVIRALVVKLSGDLCELIRGFAHVVDFKDIVRRVARKFVEVVAEALDVGHVVAAHADGVGRDVVAANEFVRDSRINRREVFNA